MLVLQGFFAAVDKSTAVFAGADTCVQPRGDDILGEDYVLDDSVFSVDRDLNLFSLGDIAEKVAGAVILRDCLRCGCWGYAFCKT